MSVACLYTLSGASGSGKTTLLESVVSDPRCNAVIGTKYAERPRRDGFDDIVHVPDIAACDADVKYVINERRYGIDTRSVWSNLEAGRNVVFVISDLHVVRRLKALFGKRARAIYLSSSIDPEKLRAIHSLRHPFMPSAAQRQQLLQQFLRLESAARLEFWGDLFACMSELLEEWRDYIPESRSAEVRQAKIRSFHDRYIDNIALFDHVVLNYYEPHEMREQIVAIMSSATAARRRDLSPPLIFVVAAASGAGKGELLQTLDLIANHEVQLMAKMAGRRPKPNDKRDGVIPVGENPFPREFDIQWTFHGDTKYAVSSSAIEAAIRAGRHQIVVSNMGQFSMFRSRYPGRVVFLYLHRVQSEDELRIYQNRNCASEEEAALRVAEVRAVHSQYMERIAEFDHVLLNTAFREDLFDQMLGLLEYYGSDT